MLEQNNFYDEQFKHNYYNPVMDFKPNLQFDWLRMHGVIFNRLLW